MDIAVNLRHEYDGPGYTNLVLTQRDRDALKMNVFQRHETINDTPLWAGTEWERG